MGRVLSREGLYGAVLDYFERVQPDPPSELNYSTPFELLVAVILSAQCTDVRVNKLTPALFAAYPTASDLACASEEEVFGYVSSCSYPNSKARHLVEMARALVDRFAGEVPEGMDELQSLPGVGRKTANVVRSVAFGVPSLGVDTHVQRVSYRLGLVEDNRTPERVESVLTANISPEYWTRAHLWLVLHGRYVCKARVPNCSACGLSDICARRGVDLGGGKEGQS